MPITPDPTYSRIGLSLHLYLLGFKRLSLTYKSALRLSHPIHLRCIGSYLSLLIPLYLFFLSTHPLLTLSFPLPPPEIYDLGWVHILPYFLFILTLLIFPLYHPYIVRVLISSHPISKIGWVFILHSLFILPSLSVFFYYYISYLILFLYCTYYTTISSLLPVGCETPYGVCLHLIYSIIYFYCFPTFTFFLYYIFTILPYSLYLSSYP